MAITVADNFSYQGGKPLDARIKFNSISAMVETPAASLYDGCFAYVTAEKKYYSYDSTNQEDVTLGKWREYSSGGGGLTQTIRYNIVTKSTGNYDASITVNKYVDDELESSTDYLYSSLQTAVVIDHRIQLQYYSMNYHLTLLADSTTEQAGYTTQWAYNATVDLDQSFLSEAYKPYVVDGYYKSADHLFYEESTYTTAIPGKVATIYVDLSTSKSYRYDSTSQIFVRLDEEAGTTYTAGDGIDITNDVISTEKSQSGDMDEIVDELPNGGIITVTGYTPLGTILSYFGETAPKFYLACDGTTYNKSDYPELANHLLSLTNHSQYEVDGDSTKFKVPDLRGEFLRGTGTNSHANQGNGETVGTHQDGTEHVNSFVYGEQWMGIFTEPASGAYGAKCKKSDSAVLLSDGYVQNSQAYSRTQSATQTAVNFTSRPTNTSVLWCIAYKDIYSNPMNDYSTSEKVVGTWIDGKPLYQKTIDCGALPNATTKTVDTNIANANQLIYWTGCVGNAGKMVLPRIFKDNADVMATFAGDLSHIVIKTESNRSSLNAYITVQYTKTTD